ncbi:hypothetical protein P3342_004117 [Pyrenophora teres f. teres]|nr:hypothetical protein P3342_004117 [Pyrenophora teres f. teres]
MRSSASPFWRTASNSATSPPNKKVIGASYSHADILNFTSLSVSGSNSRPRTPPSATHSRESSTAPSRSSKTISPRPSRATYSYFMNDTHQDWDEGDEDDTDNMFEDDEDEFGLPSIANMRRKGRRKQTIKAKDSGGTVGKDGAGATAWRG